MGWTTPKFQTSAWPNRWQKAPHDYACRSGLGTPRYMSPKQVEGKPVEQRSDIYSLGLIVYEMVAGEVPFKGDSAFQEMYQRVTQKPRNPKEVNPDLPDYVARILLHCLERDLTLRYQQARDVLRDLESETSATPSRSVPRARSRLLLHCGGPPADCSSFCFGE